MKKRQADRGKGGGGEEYPPPSQHFMQEKHSNLKIVFSHASGGFLRDESFIINFLITKHMLYSRRFSPMNLYLYITCLGVCFFVSNKRQNGLTDPAQIFCGTSHDPGEG